MANILNKSPKWELLKSHGVDEKEKHEERCWGNRDYSEVTYLRKEKYLIIDIRYEVVYYELQWYSKF